jgi:hypothetical protein
MSYDLAG